MERAVDRLFVTGTDTGVGKTVVSAALLHAFRAHGRRAVGMKPVASGCERAPEGWRNEDALALQAASDPRPPYDDVNPYALPAPLAPEIAARDAGVDVQLGVLVSAFERLHPLADMVLVEGVGGWAAPLTATLDQRHLVQELRLPVVLVVGMRLGCINHARLSARDPGRRRTPDGLDRQRSRSGDGASRRELRPALGAHAGAVLGTVAACAGHRRRTTQPAHRDSLVAGPEGPPAGKLRATKNPAAWGLPGRVCAEGGEGRAITG